MSDPASTRKTATLASLALLVFAGLCAVPLSAWLQRAADPYSWKAILSMGSLVCALAASGALWRSESRSPAIAGGAVMLASLARVGAPADWSGFSFLLIAGTLVLLMPVIHAALSLK